MTLISLHFTQRFENSNLGALCKSVIVDFGSKTIPYSSNGSTSIGSLSDYISAGDYTICSVTPYTTSAGNAMAFVRRDQSGGALYIHVRNIFGSEITTNVYARVFMIKTSLLN